MSLDEYLDRLRLLAFKAPFRLMAWLGAHRLLARFCALFIDEVDAGGSRRAAFGRARDDRRTILVLDYVRFRGDVDLFAKADDLLILSLSWNLLRYMLAAFVRHPTRAEWNDRPGGRIPRSVFAYSPPGTGIYAERERYRAFLKRFLPILFESLGVDVVMNSDFRFRRDMDISRVASELGYPHICFYREAMYLIPANVHIATMRHREIGPFWGDMIAVQNEVARDMLLAADFAKPEHFAIRGCPRMDAFLDAIRTHRKPAAAGRQIAYFSCPSGAQLKDLSRFDFFANACETVRALAELAKQDASLRVVIKMKDDHIEAGQMQRFEAAIADVAGKGGRLTNVEFVTDRMGTHDVLLNSDVIVAMQTTVVLEAGVAGKPLILPHPKALREKAGAEQVLMYRDHYDLFDVPDDADDLKRLAKQRLADGRVPDAVMEKRRALFERYVSPLDGGATNTSLAIIREVAERSRDREKARAIESTVEIGVEA